MKSAAHLIKDLREEGIALSVFGENLEVSSQDKDIDDDTLTLIKENKEKILAYLRSFSRDEGYSKIARTPVSDSYPLSDAQKRLWILSQAQEDSGAYNIPFQIVLDGEHDLESFKKAVGAIIERHEILRTVFRENESGEVRQVILNLNQVDFEIRYHDLTNNKGGHQEMDGYIKNDSGKPFNLAQGPLLRICLFEISTNHYVFYCNMHHIISDAWSMRVLSNELFQYYEYFRNGRELRLRELEIQYKDYAVWQLAQVGTSLFRNHSSYWKDKLNSNIPALNLPTGKKRPLVKTSSGHVLAIHLTKDLSLKLKDYSIKNGGTLFMGLVASFKAVLYRYTGEEDLVVGSPIAAREHADLADQIGFYVNTLALRTKVNAHAGFNELFAHVKHTIIDAYAHQNYPFDRLVEEMNIERDTSRSVIFDVMVILQNESSDEEWRKIEPGVIQDRGNRLCKFDLTIYAKEEGEHMRLEFEYNSDVYEAAVISQFIFHYQQMLDCMLINPNKSLMSIDFLTKAERLELLHKFNDTKVFSPSHKTGIDLFRQQVLANPDNTAVLYKDSKLTYKQLHELTNQLATHLRDFHDIQHGDLVGLKIERSEWMVVSILAVLKSGGAYIPVDIEFPQERIDYIEHDSNYKLCIDDKVLETFNQNRSSYSTADVALNVKPEDVAYIIYTSGTSGNPKGVMVNHFNLASFIDNLDTQINLRKVQKLGAATRFTFDISILEILGALCTGKEMILFSQDDLSDPVKLMNQVQVSGVDGLQLTPSRLSQLYETNLNFPSNLKVMLVGGEAMPQKLYERLKAESFESINVYGPTETTIWSTRLIVKESNKLSIGGPLQNEQIYILSSNNLLQPKGVAGELCIGGEGIAVGYLNNPELTREKFVENPFVDGERLYKTGDLCRWLPDGNIEFLGRKDQQVKLRGYRIELEEIENAVAGFSGNIHQVIVTIQEIDHEASLVTYVVADVAFNKRELSGYLRKKLPSHMIPNYYIQLENMPLNSSGKIDRKALPKVGKSDVIKHEYVAPRSDVEEGLVQIWQEVLNIDEIGVTDNFFELGGHSLRAVKIISKVRQRFNINVEVNELFQTPNISELAREVESRSWQKEQVSHEGIMDNKTI